MLDLIDILESFNRKERFFLVSQALGLPKFTLSREFRLELAEAVGLEQGIEIPPNAFAAMDYHLDWVAASFAKSRAETAGDDANCVFRNPGDGIDQPIQGDIEDIDLLVAFKHDGHYHLILVEAKAYDSSGYAYFTNKQLKSKAARLKQIFGDDGKKYDRVTPHFLLMSRKPPTSRLTVSWPQWVLRGKEMPAHLQISLPPETTRRTVGRSDKDGKSAADGSHFIIKSLKE